MSISNFRYSNPWGLGVNLAEIDNGIIKYNSEFNSYPTSIQLSYQAVSHIVAVVPLHIRSSFSEPKNLYILTAAGLLLIKINNELDINTMILSNDEFDKAINSILSE